jgi:uncharacterized membrane protein
MLPQRISSRSLLAAIAFTAGCSSFSATINKVEADAGNTSGGTPNVGGSTSAGGSSAIGSSGTTGGTSQTSTYPSGSGGTSAPVGGSGVGGISNSSGNSATGNATSSGATTTIGGASSVGGSSSIAVSTLGGTTALGSSPTGGGPPSTGGTNGTGGNATGGASTDPCATVTCLNGGTCKATGGTYTCSCVGGYFGTRCETAHFEWLGLDGAYALAISADGKVVVGSITAASGKEVPARWTRETGFMALESKSDIIDQGQASAANADGTAIAGHAVTGNHGGAFRWNAAEGLVYLGIDIASSATGVTSNGNAIVGTMAGPTNSPGCHAFRWTPGGGVVDLVALGLSCSVVGVSADGTLIAGNYAPVSDDYATLPFTWTQTSGIVRITNSPGAGATALSLDGSTVVGQDGDAFRSGNSIGFTYISTGNSLSPSVVNGDGTVVAGGGGAGALAAWIWDPTDGARSFDGVLTGLGANLTEWRTGEAALRINAISSDGKVLVGTGYRNGKTTSWIARL